MITATEETETEPIENEKITPTVRPAVALIWPCPKCKAFYNVTKHFEPTVEANFANGSKISPLKGICEHCEKETRLRSEDHDHVLAEVNWRRVRERRNLIALAEGLNMLGGRPTSSELYTMWNQTVGYTGKKRIPQPFLRWHRRGA